MTTQVRGVRVDQHQWPAVSARLAALQSPSTVTVNITPGSTRNEAVNAFLTALLEATEPTIMPGLPDRAAAV